MSLNEQGRATNSQVFTLLSIGYTKMKLRDMENAGYSVKYMTELDYVNYIEGHSSLKQIREFLEEIMELN